MSECVCLSVRCLSIYIILIKFESLCVCPSVCLSDYSYTFEIRITNDTVGAGYSESTLGRSRLIANRFGCALPASHKVLSIFACLSANSLIANDGLLRR